MNTIDPLTGARASLCPYIQAVSNEIYMTEMYYCKCPSLQGKEHVPSVGHLSSHCLADCGYKPCPYYKKAANVAGQESNDEGVMRKRKYQFTG